MCLRERASARAVEQRALDWAGLSLRLGEAIIFNLCFVLLLASLANETSALVQGPVAGRGPRDELGPHGRARLGREALRSGIEPTRMTP